MKLAESEAQKYLLRVTAVVDSVLEARSRDSLFPMIRERMARQIGRHVADRHTPTTSQRTHQGQREYQIELYVMEPERFHDLLRDAYEAGIREEREARFR